MSKDNKGKKFIKYINKRMSRFQVYGQGKIIVYLVKNNNIMLMTHGENNTFNVLPLFHT